MNTIFYGDVQKPKSSKKNNLRPDCNNARILIPNQQNASPVPKSKSSSTSDALCSASSSYKVANYEIQKLFLCYAANIDSIHLYLSDLHSVEYGRSKNGNGHSTKVRCTRYKYYYKIYTMDPDSCPCDALAYNNSYNRFEHISSNFKST